MVKSIDEKIHILAERWLDEIRSGKDLENEENSYDLQVTEFSFFAKPEMQWDFLNIAIDLAENDDELSKIAVNCFEQLMSKHGDKYIDRVENLSSDNPKFQTMVKHSWRHMMNDAVWKRVEKIQGV